MKLLRIIGLTLGFGAALYFLFIFFVIARPSIDNYFGRIDFDSDKWKSWKMTDDEMTVRWDMTHDLQEKHELNGMTKEQIIELLGQPESKSDSEWTYDLGMARSGMIPEH